MSYARFGWDGSDVYVISGFDRDYGSGWGCISCILVEEGFFAIVEQAMINHLLAHRNAGHTVPQEAFDRLVAERDGKEWTSTERFTDVLRRNPKMIGTTQEEIDEIVDRIEVEMEKEDN